MVERNAPNSEPDSMPILTYGCGLYIHMRFMPLGNTSPVTSWNRAQRFSAYMRYRNRNATVATQMNIVSGTPGTFMLRGCSVSASASTPIDGTACTSSG